MCSAIGAAAWCISVTIEDGTAVRTLRGIDSTHDGTSGLRVLATAGNTVYSLAEYPATASAIMQGDAFTAAVDFADSDPAEVALLTELGYRAVLGVGVPDADTQYLLELYWDGSHADLSAIAPHVRVLTQYCTTAACRP